MSIEISKRDAINQENIREKFIEFAEKNEDQIDISFNRKDVTLKIKKGKENMIINNEFNSNEDEDNREEDEKEP